MLHKKLGKSRLSLRRKKRIFLDQSKIFHFEQETMSSSLPYDNQKKLTITKQCFALIKLAYDAGWGKRVLLNWIPVKKTNETGMKLGSR